VCGRGAHSLRVATADRSYRRPAPSRRRTLITNPGRSRMTTHDDAATAVDENIAGLVAVGRPAIANPDLVTPRQTKKTRR
jgi:2,4-dienoyl-CoA reductase-like NADH-dependent reductase (Old Yellow Enzyme family)